MYSKNKKILLISIILFIILTCIAVALLPFLLIKNNTIEPEEKTKTEEKIEKEEEKPVEEVPEEPKEEEKKEEPKEEIKKEEPKPVEIPKPKVEEKTVEIQKPKTEEPPITYSCPSGYTQDGNKCHLTVDATLKCPEGTDEGGEPTGCFKFSEAIETQEESCPSGQVWLEMISLGGPSKYYCYPSYDKVYTCEDGYTLNGNKCIIKTIDATKN
ncbi:MAG: hypothetical protein IKP07_02480 [Bacilli bacterium]|nr:hypothetical protein [Bacilli bacterium]